MNKRSVGAALTALLLSCAAAQAGTTQYALNLTGSNIVGSGDLDGIGVGTITFNPGAGTISWSITYANLDAITGWGIHQGGPGVNGSQAATSSAAAAAGMGVYSGSGNFSSGLQNAILSAGTNAYFIIKTSAFTGGAIRAQLGTPTPTPGAAGLLAIAGLAATRRRR